MAQRIRQLIAVIGASVAIQAAEPVERVIRFRVFSANPEPPITFVPVKDARARRLDFYPTEASGPYSYRGVGPLVFRDEAGSEVASVTLADELGDVLLLFSGREIFVVDLAERSRPSGSLSIGNFSGLKLTGTWRGRVLEVIGGLNPSLAGGRSPNLVLRTPANGRTYQAFADTIPISPDERKLLLLFPPFTPGSIEPQWRLLTL